MEQREPSSAPSNETTRPIGVNAAGIPVYHTDTYRPPISKQPERRTKTTILKGRERILASRDESY